ncbi:MAG: carboxylate--amine ligase, partial [Candidatus Nanopelagicales bacterium]
GYTLPQPKMWLVRENKWRAARYGLDAEIVIDDRGNNMQPVRDAILELADDLAPIARKIGCEEELGRVEQLLDIGASYQRQRAVAAENDGDLRSVVDLLLREMDEGIFPA